jgi:methenyltetrahydromethanopterin cyclohydrolase
MNAVQQNWGDNMTRADYKKLGSIRKRAVVLDLCDMKESIQLEMDMELAFKYFNLNLDKLLRASDLDFVHDICGIQKHLNRQTKTFDDCFVPRFSRPKKG